MGFEILPIEPGEIDMVDPIYDVFEITGAQKWVPARFKTSGEALTLNAIKTTPLDIFLDAVDHDTLVQPERLLEAPDPTDYQTPHIPEEVSFKAYTSTKAP